MFLGIELMGQVIQLFIFKKLIFGKETVIAEYFF